MANNGGGGGQGHGNGKGKGKGKGKFNRNHEHGEKPGQGGGGGGSGSESDPLAGLPDTVAAIVEAAGTLGYGSQLSDITQEIHQARGHRGVIDRAYDAYASELGNVQAAQQAATAQAQQTVMGAAQGLQGATMAAGTAGADAARAQAGLLGQDQGVAQAYTALAPMASNALGQTAGTEIGRQANVGLANFSDLGRRGLTAERGRIQDKESLRDAISELRTDRRDIQTQQGAAMTQAMFDYLQQQEENRIAMMGMQLDQKQFRSDKKMDQAELLLAQQAQATDAANILFDNQLDASEFEQQQHQDRHDNRQDRHDDRQDGADSGLSPSDAQAYEHYVQQVNGAVSRMNQLIEGGASVQTARRRTQQQQSIPEWVVRAATDLVRHGELTDSTRGMVKGHLPGGTLPQGWR